MLAGWMDIASGHDRDEGRWPSMEHSERERPRWRRHALANGSEFEIGWGN